jgi:hypothetical protein
MITKTLIAAAAVSAIALGASAPANAKVNVDLYLGGFGPGYYEPAPVYGGYDDDYGYEPRRRHYSYGISCEDGRDAVRSSGFRKVRPVDCSGKRYTYKARQNGDTFIVKVSRRSGNIISVQETY